jgi:hypothetical protein
MREEKEKKSDDFKQLLGGATETSDAKVLRKCQPVSGWATRRSGRPRG